MKESSLSVSGVAHDLNNQIMILLFSLDRITALYPELMEATQAFRAAEQCGKLVAQLLPQRRNPNPAPTLSLRELIGETAMAIRCFLPACNRLEVDCRTDTRVPAVAAELHHAIVNLCLNAMDAMNGPGLIRIVADEEPRGLSISVQDTGPGVPIAIRERIFEPRFTTRRAAGAGLGLTRVCEIVKSLNGKIELEDVFPHGACFRMTFPLALQ